MFNSNYKFPSKDDAEVRARADKCMDELLDFFPMPNKQWEQYFREYAREYALSGFVERVAGVVDHCKSRIIVPKPQQVFAALQLPADKIKVIIVGQDPYPTPGDAHGLAFSVEHGGIPASLRNIFIEIQRDCGGPMRNKGNLSDWVQQGVLLINTYLTTDPREPGAHKHLNWAEIVIPIVQHTLESSPDCVLMLWGTHATKYCSAFSAGHKRALVLSCGHPSPMAYNTANANGFKACGHFARANAHLVSRGHLPIMWNGIDPITQFLVT